MITLPEALEYEVASSKLAASISWPLAQNVLAWWFSRKTTRKYTRYQAIKNLEELGKKYL